MNKKILIAGLLISVMLLVPINSAYSNNGLSLKNNEENLLYNTMLDDTWVKTYDEVGDCGTSVQHTLDGGYIVVAGNWVFKTDNNGNILWKKSSPSVYHIAESVTVTDDNKYVITGNFDYYKVFLLKWDTDGTLIWNKTYASGTEGLEVIQTSDGGYAISGYDDAQDIILIKTDSNASINWVKRFDNDGWPDMGKSLKQTPDGGYIILGYSFYISCIWLLRTDENGTLLWDKKYNGTGEVYSDSIDITDDGGYIITGHTISGNFVEDVWLLRTDENGTKLWEKTFGTPNLADSGNSVIATNDGGYIIAGYIRVNFRDRDAILIKTDNLGNMEWSKTYGGSFFDGGESVQQTTDGGYILTGAYQPRSGLFNLLNHNVFLIKTDSNGNAPPLSKTKDIGIRNRVFDNSLFLRFLERYPLLNLFLQRLTIF